MLKMHAAGLFFVKIFSVKIQQNNTGKISKKYQKKFILGLCNAVKIYYNNYVGLFSGLKFCNILSERKYAR